MEKRPIGIFSFFAGCGLLDLGFEAEGYNTLYVNEYFTPFLDAYKHSRSVMGIPEPRHGYSDQSIEEIDGNTMHAMVKAAEKDGILTGFIGGPPCPDFSVGGKNRGHEGENGRLSRVYIDLVCAAKPDFFVFENVKGLWRTKRHRAFYESLKADLLAAGYHLHERLINAIEFGAPQDRDRIILMGFRSPTFTAGDLVWCNVVHPDRSAFEYNWPIQDPFEERSFKPAPNHLPLELTVQHWFDKNDVLNHPNAGHGFKPRAGLKRFLTVDEGDDSRKSYKRLHRWRYSPTAAYGNNEVHIHPYEARRITVAEALAIQTAPREFELPSTMSLSAMFKTVGNGVPFLAAKGIAATVKGFIDDNNCSESSSRNIAAE